MGLFNSGLYIWLEHFLVEILVLAYLELSSGATQISQQRFLCPVWRECFWLLLEKTVFFPQIANTHPILWFIIKITFSHLNMIYVKDTKIARRQRWWTVKIYLNGICLSKDVLNILLFMCLWRLIRRLELSLSSFHPSASNIRREDRTGDWVQPSMASVLINHVTKPQ